MTPPITDTTTQAKSIFWGFLLILMAIVALGLFVGYQLFSPKRTISVIGTGKEIVQSNKATITFAFTSRANSKDVAVTQGEQEFTDLLTVINNFQPTEVKRIAYQVQELTNGTFQYVSGASVTVEGSENITGLQRTISSNNAQIASVLYLPEDEQTTTQRVQELALQNAREKAEQIAAASNGKVGKILIVSEQGSNTQTGNSVTSLSKDINSPLNQVELQSVMSVTYELR